ncbi:MAG TPA: Xaa-Pro peptidase family protein [Gaiellaceae bacterium]|nr:Xaa-Pro peptidase family protein [Gaiellaceae bacterium]
MNDVLIYGDSMHVPEMRHEVPVPVPDPFLYVERNGDRHAVVTSYEVSRLEPAGIHAHPYEEFGYDELLAQGLPREEAVLRTVENAVEQLGVEAAVVPVAFPLGLADRLRDRGVELKPDRELFAKRRRVKNASELDGIRKAQRGTEAAMAAARDMLRASEASGGTLVLDDAPLTSERIKARIVEVFNEHDLVSDEMIVAHGGQAASGHDMGSGPIAAGESVVIDLFPRDRGSGCYADMTRTYVVGEVPEELAEYHRLVQDALAKSLAAVRAGAEGSEVYRLACDVFHEAGYPTQLSKQPGEVLANGFFHGLGHGVGLQVHEPPWLSRDPSQLVAGDVITLEPGLYREGFGGVRLEDLVLVTKDGAENLTDFPYDLTP